jgi:hypothetical protein
VSGGDGTPDAVVAPGGSGCGVQFDGGNGGVAASTTADLAAGEGMGASGEGAYGGGGGSVGRARIATFDATFMQDASAILSVVVTTDMLQTQ